MRTVTFQSVFEAILQRHGLDPAADAFNQDTAQSITEHINTRAKTAVEMWDFSELSRTEERAFRQVWNNTRQFRRAGDDNGLPDEVYYLTNAKYYVVAATAPTDPPVGTLPTNTTYFTELTSYEPFIARDQPFRRSLGVIRGIYKSNPSLNGSCLDGRLRYRPSERGVWVSGDYGTTVFVWYSLLPPQFTAKPWIDGKPYVPDDRVFYVVDGNCYRCFAATSVAIPTNASFWTLEPMPELIADYVKAGAYADCLKESPIPTDQSGAIARAQAISAAEAEADRYIQGEIDKQLIGGERHFYTRPIWRGDGWCQSKRWGGDKVVALTTENDIPDVAPAVGDQPQVGLFYYSTVASLKTTTPTLVATASTRLLLVGAMAVIKTGQHFRLDAGPATNTDPGEGTPFDYDATTNNKHWVEVL